MCVCIFVCLNLASQCHLLHFHFAHFISRSFFQFFSLLMCGFFCFRVCVDDGRKQPCRFFLLVLLFVWLPVRSSQPPSHRPICSLSQYLLCLPSLWLVCLVLLLFNAEHWMCTHSCGFSYLRLLLFDNLLRRCNAVLMPCSTFHLCQLAAQSVKDAEYIHIILSFTLWVVSVWIDVANRN